MVLTALAAILAMIPLTRNVFWGPMAFAIMGGGRSPRVAKQFVEYRLAVTAAEKP